MSEASYQLNVQRGVTGPHTATCLMAAYDRISAVTGVHTQTYEQYEALRERYVEATGDNSNFVPQDIVKNFAALKIEFRRQLGVEGTKNIVGLRANSKPELQRALGKLTTGGFRPAVYLDTGGLHAVGVVNRGNDYYDVRSTWSPFPANEPVHLSDLFGMLDLPPRHRKRENSSRKTVQEWNVVALPPEPAGAKPPHPHV